ncbi:hypothetical protein [Pseudoleptotrichia goodfellowii]|jgi:hypothetical protein|uniref:Uncharacterized protein n=1 Tax=Pseudoleptotrichia goodfellowii F0264 TaxID=596323 RepID=D0GNV9_9FUSO|nr:hypothetical protein [Pseudoleptotrichia goodfellowii]EEY34200.1 hypothetical protein HMPREF0554_0812 [Pseudoleptotrichia goodfellowii F0264]DAN70592.1 MAG TPA: hypothetical protein [Caudoviricetes sp.]
MLKEILRNKVILEGLSVLIPIIVTYILAKLKTNSTIRKFIPEGVVFADSLDTSNENKLIRAVTQIELLVLSVTPALFKPIVDFLINPKYIVKMIERYLTKKKVEKQELLEKENV